MKCRISESHKLKNKTAVTKVQPRRKTLLYRYSSNGDLCDSVFYSALATR